MSQESQNFSDHAYIPDTENIPQFKDPSNTSKIWTKLIPHNNLIILGLSLPFLFGIDLWIIINDSSLTPFWLMMLAAFALFIVFLGLEKIVFSKKFSHNKSRLDLYILLLVILRNITFFLNFIPYIQLIGLTLLVLGAVPYLILYTVLIWFRKKHS